MYAKALFGAALLAAALAPVSASALVIGGYTFDDLQFGDTWIASDGGAQASDNWLNVANVDPGFAAYLTGANLNTGLANLAYYTYTIGYNTPIRNEAGFDFAVITARYSSTDIHLSVSEDASTFSAQRTYGPELGIDSGVTTAFWYGLNYGPFKASLYLTLIDLSDFGIADGATVSAIMLDTGLTGIDLLRIAGLKHGAVTPPADVPEPATLALFGAGLAALTLRRRRKA